ncbi:hypothetical protein N9N67_10290, partial [Bacteriovoracaceae bacterium]|nr:hypothetical protein [Bacteriovoracaceae bacterium]
MAILNRLSTIIFISLFTLSLSFSAEMTAQKVFDQNFKLIKDNKGELLYIQKKFQLKKFKLKDFVAKIKEAINIEIDYQKKTASLMGEEKYIQELNNILQIDEGDSLNHHPDYQKEIKNKKRVRRSLLNLRKVNWGKNFNTVQSEPAIKEFGQKIKKILATFNFTILAAAQDKRFFMKKQILNKALNEVIKILRKKYSNIPILGFASFLVTKVHQFILQERMFQQNMLLELMFYHEKDLNLKVTEINHIVSSIFESRIDLQNRMERRKLENNWDGYGMLQLFTYERNALANISKFKNSKNINLGFFEGTFSNRKGKKTNGIYHHFITNHQFTRKKALALDYNNKKRVLRLRTLLFVAQAGINFIPRMPGFIKNIANNFINSMTKAQI